MLVTVLSMPTPGGWNVTQSPEVLTTLPDVTVAVFVTPPVGQVPGVVEPAVGASLPLTVYWYVVFAGMDPVQTVFSPGV